MHEMLPGDPKAEVCAMKQGWDPREQDSRGQLTQG